MDFINKIVKDSEILNEFYENYTNSILLKINKYLGVDYNLIEELYNYNIDDKNLYYIVEEFKSDISYYKLKLFFKTDFNIKNLKLKDLINKIKDNLYDYLLIRKLYKNKYNFSEDELIKLSKKLFYLKNNKLDEILIILRYRYDDNYFITKLDKELGLLFKNIKLQNTKLLTYIYYECIEYLDMLIISGYEYNFDEIIQYCSNNKKYKSLRYFLNI